MLPKNNRLKKTKEIKQAFYTKYRANTKFTKIFLRKKRDPEFQLLVIVSSKISKRAVKRNRIRRRIVGLFERIEGEHKNLSYFTCVVQVKNKDILTQRTEVLENDILGTVKKLRLEADKFKPQKNNFSTQAKKINRDKN